MRAKKLISILVSAIVAATLLLTGCASPDSAEPSSSVEASGIPNLVSNGKLTVLLSPDYPPFEDIEGTNVVGFDVDLACAVAEKLGLEPEFAQMEFDTIIPAIAAGGVGDVAISGISVEPERDREIDYSIAYYMDNIGVAVLPDSEIDIDNSKQMLNQPTTVIGVQTGTTGEIFAQENFPNAIVQSYANSKDCYVALEAGHIDAICTNLAVIEHAIDTYHDAKLVLEVGTAEEYAAIVSPSNPELLERINEALGELQEDGTIQALLSKWF